MTYLQAVSTGVVLIDARGQEGRNDILTCTAHSPATDGGPIHRGLLHAPQPVSCGEPTVPHSATLTTPIEQKRGANHAALLPTDEQ
jgi:hypothetical protein